MPYWQGLGKLANQFDSANTDHPELQLVCH